MKRAFLFLVILLNFLAGYAQEYISDTILVRTDITPDVVSKHYVIRGTREMVIFIYKEKLDTVFYNSVSDYTMERYKHELYLNRLRNKPVSKIGADEVFDYFPLGATFTDVVNRLGNKKVYVTNTGFKVLFYNKFHKKNEVLEFRFEDEKLSSLSRPSTNTLPTNDIQEAFQLLKLRDDLKKILK